jgi:flagellin
MNKLSSGKKITQAADDAAGLAISEKMKAQIRGLDQAKLNTEQATELIKTSDGAMGEIESSLQRMRELSVQAANETLTDEDRKAIQAEFTQLSKQIDSTSKTTEFNTIKTIDGSLRNISPKSAVETGTPISTPISIHDDTPAVVESGYPINFYSGVEIHDGKQAFTELNLNSPINISSPNDKLSIAYVDENNISHTGNLSLSAISIPTGTIDQLASSIQNKIDGSVLSGKISVSTVSPDKIILTSNSPEPNVNVKININPTSDSAANKMIGEPAVMTGSLNNPITINTGDSLKLTYTDSTGTTNSKILTLDTYNSSTTASHPQDLATMIQNKINATSLNGKVTVSIDNGNLKFESADLGPYANVNIVNNSSDPYDVSGSIFFSKIAQNGSLNQDVTLGVTRNDQLKITFNDKTKASSTQFDEDSGFNISNPEWTEKTFQITIPHNIYHNASVFSTAINQAISDAGYADKISVDYDSEGDLSINADAKMKFITANEGTNATLKLEDVNSTKGSTMFSALGLNSITERGIDKTDTFAIEVNAQYTEREVKDEELSSEDIQKLLNDKILYTANGYIMEDPLNPDDFIEYTKIQGTGETQQITLSSGNYSKEDFASALQYAINNSTNQLGNDVTVTGDVNGGFNISTPQQNGSKSSIRFVAPTSSPGNESPFNTSMDELLKNFLSVTGFDYNRHVGKEGTGKMDIQVGANSNQQVEIKIDSVRAGALGVKYLDITTSQKASDAISIIDNAINKVSSERTNLGAVQNAFEHVISNLENSSTNLTSAQSKIEDADMAKEMSTFSKHNVLSQAAQSMLTQAYKQPQQVVQLLNDLK